MPDQPRDKRPVEEVAGPRVAHSRNPARFRYVLGRSLAALDTGEDLAETPLDTRDPVALAAQIEAVAGARRLNSDPKKDRT